MYERPENVFLVVAAIFFIVAVISVVLQARDERKRREQEAIADRAEAEYEQWKKERGLS